MFTVILVMLSGVGVGFLLRGRRIHAVSRVITFFIWVLLFLVGVEVGGNPRVMGGLAGLGVEAVVLAVAGVLGCGVLCRIVFKDGKANG